MQSSISNLYNCGSIVQNESVQCVALSSHLSPCKYTIHYASDSHIDVSSEDTSRVGMQQTLTARATAARRSDTHD